MENTLGTRELLVGLAMEIYAIYLIVVGILILWKKKRILEPNHQYRIWLMKKTGKRRRAIEYEEFLKDGKNWTFTGIYFLVVGILMAVGVSILGKILF